MFRQCILTTHNHWKWSIQLWIQNFDDEFYECTLCLFWQNMHEHKRKYFHLNSIDIYKYSGPLVIHLSGWSSQILGQLQSSPLTLVIWDNLVMVPITRGNLREIVLWDVWSMKIQPLLVYPLYSRNVISWVLQVPLSFILPLYWSDKISCGPLRRECQHSYVLFWCLWLLGREEVLEL